MTSTARSNPPRARKPATVNVDLILECASRGSGSYMIEAARCGEAERRVLRPAKAPRPGQAARARVAAEAAQ